MQVKDIMTKEVLTAAPTDKISKVAHILTENRIHGVPVVDEGKKIIGIITETDFFVTDSPDLYIPAYIKFLKETKMKGEVGSEKKEQVEKLMNSEAKDIMTAECFTIKPEADIEEAVKVFQEKQLHTIPVANDDGVLEGIITVADIIKLI